MNHDPYNHSGINSGADFDGATYVPALDKARLTGQLRRVYEVLMDGRWHSLSEISYLAKAPESSCSARLRDLRKSKFGAHTVYTKRSIGGWFKYRLEIEPQRELF